MRLGQLARKLNTSIPEIVEFFTERGLDISEHPNSKLDDVQEELVRSAFSGEPFYIPQIGSSEESEAQPEGPAAEQDVSAPEEEADERPDAPILSEPAANEIEVIRAPKVELPGLKVLGKIELPEPKPEKKEEPEELRKPVSKPGKNIPGRRPVETPEEREARRIRNKKAQLKREHQEQERKLERERRMKKKKKEQFYKERVGQKAPQSKAIPETVKKRPSRTTSSQQRRPKTILGRIWLWLNT